MRKFLTFVVFVTALSQLQTWTYGMECKNGTNFVSKDETELEPSLEKHEGALLLLLGFGSLSIFLAVVYTLIRRYVFQDVNNVDSSFDAGGNVSTSLTAVTLASQLLWPGDLLQSVTICVKYGIAGAFWYCATAMINISLFPLLSFKFKTRAPGAKTFLQVIKARFGTRTHGIFIFFALMVNVVILASIFVGGIAVLQATIKDASPEFCVLVLVFLCGGYAFIGGLGSTFYVSYFNAVATFLVLSIFVINIIHSDDMPFGSLKEIYDNVNCHPAVKGNYEGSRFTFLSRDAMLFAVQSLFLVASITYCDQASWQSRIAAKPLQGAIGFLVGSFLWFCVPGSIGLLAGMTYISETAKNGSFALSIEQIDSGVVSAYMAEKAMGSAGGIMILTMLTMLSMSTGSGEIMAVSSIIIYDIYQTYVLPFRRYLPFGHCICCGLKQPQSEKVQDLTSPKGTYSKCECPTVVDCQYCNQDNCNILSVNKSPGKVMQYTCPHHGAFRMYQDSLIQFKNWCVLWVSVALIPFGLCLYAVELDLNWTMLTGIVLMVPSVPGVILSILWVKTTSKGMIVGCISGLIIGAIANILVSVFHYEWQGGFIRATSAPYSVLAGCACGFFLSLVLTILISLATHGIKTKQDETDEWEKLRNIDNPLHPWSFEIGDEFPDLSDGRQRPSAKEMEHSARYGKYASIIGSIVFFFLFIIIIPGILASLKVLSFEEFEVWAFIITSVLFASTVAIIVVTPLEEVRSIVKQILTNKKETSTSSHLEPSGNSEGKAVTFNNGHDKEVFEIGEGNTQM